MEDLEEEPSHSPTHLLAIVDQVELVDIVVHGAAGLGQCAQVRDQRHVIALIVELVLELGSVEDGQSVTEAVGITQDLMILLNLALLNVLDVLEDELNATVQHLDGVVLRDEVLRRGG